MNPTPEEIKAAEMVSFLKQSNRDIYAWMKAGRIDFLGCSEPYVREKIDALIFALKELKRHNKAVDKYQSRFPQ